MTDKEIRERLCKLLRSLPYGSKTPLARVCGVGTNRHLKAIARFNAYLFPAVAKRLEAVMRAIESGDLVLRETGSQRVRRRVRRYPKLVWVWRERD